MKLIIYLTMLVLLINLANADYIEVGYLMNDEIAGEIISNEEIGFFRSYCGNGFCEDTENINTCSIDCKEVKGNRDAGDIIVLSQAECPMGYTLIENKCIKEKTSPIYLSIFFGTLFIGSILIIIFLYLRRKNLKLQ